MKLYGLRAIGAIVLGGLTIMSGTSAGAATINIACPGQTLQSGVDAANTGDTISVTGTCTENVIIRNEKVRIALDGGNVATIVGTAAGANQGRALNVRGKGIVIQNFTISGGTNAIEVNRGSNAVINHNVIENATGNGVHLDQLAFAVITNNTIQNNGGVGIAVSETAVARIGFNLTSDSEPSPNTISGNVGRGIVVARGSSAQILGNTISDNGDDGIGVFRGSHADISGNTINGNGTSLSGGTCASTNGCNGIKASQNSSINLGDFGDSYAAVFNTPNTTTVNNLAFGLHCGQGADLDGHWGASNPVNGALGQSSISGNCPNNLATP